MTGFSSAANYKEKGKKCLYQQKGMAVPVVTEPLITLQKNRHYT
jgi:hypothetical protein